MAQLKIAVFVVFMSSVSGYAASFSRFTVELGGDNHAEAWKQGQREMFTPGSTQDGRTYRVGDVITWDVVLECGGIHEQPGSTADGLPIWGAANIVHNLELHRDTATGPLATSARFVSSINDGSDGNRPQEAAFVASYNLGGNGPGRLIDTYAAGGPRLSVFTYPSQQPGRLIGQGAGYKEWNQSGDPTRITTPGVGMERLPNGTPGLGLVPITEGQIDTSNMEPGTYVLRVIPGSGNNALRGDRDFSQDQPSFAVTMNQTFGDEITFTLTPEPLSALLLLLGLPLVGRPRRHR